jgi:thymidylate synthase
LERVAQSEYDQLARGLPHDEYLVQCGRYQSARRQVDLVDTLIHQLKDTDERERAAAQHTRDHLKSVTYGTPHWRG